MTVHPYLRRGRPDVLAHRGASEAHPPGNSLAAFGAALDMGVDHLETDVQASADGQVVVFHDEQLDEITTGTGAVADHDWEHLRRLRYVAAGSPTDDGLVLLDDALGTWPDAFWNIDVKTDDAVDGAVEILRRHGAADRVCVAAFGARRLRRLRRRLGPGWCTACAGAEIAVVRAAAWLRLPAPRFGDVVQVPQSAKGVTVVDERFVDACHARGVLVHVWTVNDLGEMRRLRALGVDAVITDRPDAVPDP